MFDGLARECGEETEAGEFVVSPIEDVAGLDADGGVSDPAGVGVGGVGVEHFGGDEESAESGNVAVDVAEGDYALVFGKIGLVVVFAYYGGGKGVGGEDLGG